MPSSPNPAPALALTPALPPVCSEHSRSPWNPYVVASVIVICIIFLIFSYYRILRQLCCAISDLALSRNRVQRRLLDQANPDDPSLQFHSHGLESSILHSLPITQFKKNNEEEEVRPSNTNCAVCLAEFEEGDWLKHLPNCTHSFHISCIDTWFRSHSNCPLCRSHVYDLAMHDECTVSVHTLLETLRREDFHQERAQHYQIQRSRVLENSQLIYEGATAN